MGHRHEIRLRARTLRAFAAVALGLAALSLLATRAQAGLDPVGGDDSAPVASRVHGEAIRAVASSPPRDRAREELAEVRNAAGEPLEVTGAECERNLALAADRGLTLPDGWQIHCVGPGLDWNGGTHWGVTCPYEDCPEGDGPYISISNPNYYVVTHELCHANFGNDELMADSCAAEHGASLATSPYS